MIINIKQEFIDRSINRLPIEMLDLIRRLSDDEYTVTVTPESSSSTITTTSSSIVATTTDLSTVSTIHSPIAGTPVSSASDCSVIDFINQTITLTYLKIIRINSLSAEDKTVIQNIIEDLRSVLLKIYNSVADQAANLKLQVEHISQELEFKEKQIQNLLHEVECLKAEHIQINVLKQESTERKKLNIISEIMAPMKKRIYNDMLKSNIVLDYYNVNILKSFYSLVQTDLSSSEFYLNVYRTANNYSENDCRRFEQLLISISAADSLDYSRLLKFLIDKEKQNFSEHATITDFLRDARQTQDPTLTTFLSQTGLLEHFELADIDVLDKTYQKYFGYLFQRT